jgi:hypothetical protein
VPYRHWTFTIPKAIRGLFERERCLLGLLSRTAYDSIRKSFQTLFGRKDVRPGCVISIQSFGSFGANFHPHQKHIDRRANGQFGSGDRIDRLNINPVSSRSVRRPQVYSSHDALSAVKRHNPEAPARTANTNLVGVETAQDLTGQKSCDFSQNRRLTYTGCPGQ